jgi:uncharacterized membrane protein
MDIGPVQLVMYSFDQPKFGGSIAAELKRLRDRDIIRVIDALIVHKSADGEVDTRQVTDLTPEESTEFGAIAGALVGLGAGGEEGAAEGAAEGAEAIAAQGGHVFEESEMWDVLGDIPNDSAAAIVLLEHRWAIPLRDAIRGEGGVALGDMWVHPRDLVAVGLLAPEAVR